MDNTTERYLRAKVNGSLAIFEEIEEITKEYFRKNPNADSVEITLRSPKTGEEKKIIISRD